MSFQSTARKWRPDTFEDVIAQDHVARTLTNAVRGGKIGHAYIFSGPRGVGKTTAARIFAKAINCQNPQDGNPCNTCEVCSDIKSNRFIDLFEIDGASNNSVDNVRDIRDALRYPPQKGKYKVYIIDEVHMLSIGAFNALLKTLEEPPEYAIFIFATTEIHKVPATILSRCQRFDFRRISTVEILGRLKEICDAEAIQYDEESLLIIARRADGAMRDGLSILDQVVAFFGKSLNAEDLARMLSVVEQDVYFRVSDLITNKQVSGTLQLVNEITEKGYDYLEFVNGLAEHTRNLLVVVTTGETKLIDSSDAYKERYMHLASHFHYSDLIRMLNLISEFESVIKLSAQPRIRLELLLSKLCELPSTVDITTLLNKFEQVEKRLKQPALPLSKPAETQTAEPRTAYQPIPPVTKAPARPDSSAKISMAPVSEKRESVKPALKPSFPAKTPMPASVQSEPPQDDIQPVNQTPSTLSFDDVNNRFQSFLDHLSQSGKMTLYAAITHSEPASFQSGQLVLKVYRRYEQGQIDKNSETISELLSEFFKTPVTIKTELREEEAHKMMEDDQKHQFEELKVKNPFIQNLSDTFGLEPL